MKVELKDFPLNTPFDVADECPGCGGKLRATVTFTDPESDHTFGDVFWECQQCGDNGRDIVGWKLSETPVKIMGKEFYPITSRANVGPCLNCGKLVIGVPLILFLDQGRNGELDFCFPCAEKLGVLKGLKPNEVEEGGNSKNE